jgi:hypothetical protein
LILIARRKIMPGSPTMLKGYVKDAQGVGVVGVKIVGKLGTGSFTTTTVVGGGYIASWIGSGAMTITATKTGYVKGTTTVTLMAAGGVVTPPDIKLT